MDCNFDLYGRVNAMENFLANDSATAGILQTTAGTYTTNLPNDYGLTLDTYTMPNECGQASDICATPNTISAWPYTPEAPIETTEDRIKDIVNDEIAKVLRISEYPVTPKECLPFKYRLKHR